MTEARRQRLNKYLIALERKVTSLYGETYANILNFAEVKTAVNAGEDDFSWDDHPGADKRLEKAINNLAKQVESLVLNGVEDCYDDGQKHATDEVKSALGKSKANLAVVQQICSNATNARREDGATGWRYAHEKRGGLTLSDRIWETTRQARQELEIMIQDGVIEGKTAQQISQDVRGCLKNPDKLFRRVRDKETGELRLSKAAKAYHPCQGVYRSSYKNAMRVARTEVNTAYRSGEWDGYQGNPLIKGYEIRMSNNHTTTLPNGKKAALKDICDKLAGLYPKRFKWSGWHPHCRCAMIPIPLTPAEIADYLKHKNAGTLDQWKDPSIKDVPQAYKEWVSEHQDAIMAAAGNGKMAYFLQDNEWTWNPEKMRPTPLEIAEKRHNQRTQEEVEDIKRRWAERNERINKGRIESAAEKRHSERTNEREIELREFWEKKVEEGNKRRRRDEILSKAEARHAARTQEEIQEIIDKRNAELAQFAVWEKAIRETEARSKMNDWLTDEEKVIWVDGPGGTRNHLDKYYVYAKRLSERMDVIDAMRPEWNLAASHTSIFGIYQDKLEEARRMITNGFKQKASDVLIMMKKIEDIEPRYVDLRAYQQIHRGKGGNKSKIEIALDAAEELIKNGDINGAVIKIEEAEKVRKINDASALAKAEAARKRREEEAKKNAEEQERKSKKLRHEDCVTIEDFRKLYGDDMPEITKNIEKSVKRDQYTSSEYLQHRDEIEKKLKDFWKTVDFSHCTNPYDLDGYFKDGILTNLQKNGDTNTGYAASRRSYGHFAFDLPGNPGVGMGKVSKAYHLKPGEYYRCGVPCSKDPYEAFVRDNSGYGDAQLVFRRDRVIATFTMGNSLGQRTIPSLVSDPKVCSFDGKTVMNYRDKEYTIERLRYGNYYCELQFLPRKSQGNFTPKDFERITLREHPENYKKKELWEKWANEGVDIYYIDSTNKKAVLYMKGKPQITNAEAKIRLEDAKKELDELFRNELKFSNKDVSIKEIKDKISNGDYIGALDDFERYNAIDVRKAKLKGLIPDVDKWHKQFSIDELEAAHKAIEAKIDYMDKSFKVRNAPDDVLRKWAEEIDKAEHPDRYKTGAKRFQTWKIAKEAYERKRNELVYEYHKANIDSDLKVIRGFKTTNKSFNEKIQELEAKVNAKEWADVEAIINDAKVMMKDLGEIELKIGESNTVKFSASEFTQAKRDAAKWFKDPDVQKAYKEADDYMSKYAQDMWKNLSDEEKHILWLYSDGSKYINDEMLGKYSLKCVSPIDGTVRNGLADANVLTSIIEKAPELKESMWMQSGKSAEAFRAMFGVDIRSVSDLSKLIGTEGTNNIFSSCHASSGGYFTKGGSTGTSNPIVMSIYMPAGTKGVYLEPFASYGDKLRWKKGIDWTGSKRREAPSDQVEFLLQRGAKFKITNAYYKNGKWYIDVDLIEQSAVESLDTNIPGLMNRIERISRKPILI